MMMYHFNQQIHTVKKIPRCVLIASSHSLGCTETIWFVFFPCIWFASLQTMGKNRNNLLISSDFRDGQGFELKRSGSTELFIYCAFFHT